MSYPENFTRDNVIPPFLLLSVVIVCHPAVLQPYAYAVSKH